MFIKRESSTEIKPTHLFQIGYWSEADRMVVNPIDGSAGNESSGLENKTIIVTTILVIKHIFCKKDTLNCSLIIHSRSLCWNR